MKIDINKLIHYLIICFGFLPIIPNGMTGVLPIALILSSLIFYIKNPKGKPSIRNLVINSSLFFVYLFSLFYTEDIGHALIKLGPATWILIFPLIFHLFLGEYRFKKNTLSLMFKILTLSTVAFILLFFLFLTKSSSALSFSSEIPGANLLRGAMLEIPFIAKHPIYAALFVGISIIYCSNLIISERSISISPLKKYILASLILVFLSFLILIQGKGALFYLSLTFLILLSLNAKNKIRLFFLFTSTILVLGYIMVSSSKSNNRFLELIDKKTYSSETLNPYNSTQIRLEIWKSSAECIKKAPIFGYGLGDVQNVLNSNYSTKSEILLQKTYNSHNQYMGIWLSAGIVGLLIFTYFLISNLKMFWKYRLRNKASANLFLTIVCFFILNFITENILDRQLGSISFYFMINLLGAYVEGNKINTCVTQDYE